MISIVSLLVFFLSINANSQESFDLNQVYRCDKVVCPDGEENDELENSSTDFKDPNNSSSVSLQRITISTVNNNGSSSGAGESIRPNAPSPVEPSAQVSENKEIASPTPPTNNQVTSSGSHSSYSESGFINGLPQGSSNVGVGNSYNPGNIQRDSSGGSDGSDYYVDQNQSAYNPTLFNDQSSTSKRSKSKGSKQGNSSEAQSAVAIGDYGSGASSQAGGSGVAKSSSGNSGTAQPKSLLSRIAKQLGLDKFFGLSPQNRRALKRNQNQRQGRRGLALKLRKSGKKGWSSDLIRREFEAGKRDLASLPPGLGPKSMSLFLNICRHYHRYSKLENIPGNNLGCKKK